ncbi:DUF72 domain-containing protein [Jiulongibacter sediminis]|jgi:uncharacterized protein YecE (DUF72 family)|uniref:DUF72 domain-containing protein n=1 Tax=Jiulongibacter sediminis TaxID=1605367 RepID=UPI0026F2D23C|nr:DUF72 domain-containing protein [Jiulongibacter sediminis]
MKFGSVPNPELIDFTLPPDNLGTAKVLSKGNGTFEAYVGCAKWNRTDLKNFYPRGTKDELIYYSRQFNSIELNATFYRSPSGQHVVVWHDKTPEGFKFFPKIPSYISHIKRLNDVKDAVTEYLDAISHFQDKLEMIFLQLHDNFSAKNMDRLVNFIQNWPKGMPLAIELRSQDWFDDPVVAESLYELFEENSITNVITDTAGRRDLLHMRLTTPVAFIRYVGANHASDYPRLDDWLERIALWKSQGLEKLYFFVHQNLELESPLLSKYFIEKMNDQLGTNLKVPQPGEVLDGLF